MNKTEDKPDMRVIKSSTAPTLSGKSTLTYHVGVTPDSEIHLRVHSNSSSGAFSREWIALNDVQVALEKRRKGQHVTAYLLQPLFRGKSVNTPAFLLAALAQEKLVRVLKGKKREHEILDPSGFIAKVEKLIASGVNVKVKETVRKTAAKTVRSTAKKSAGETPIKKTVTKKTVRKTPVKKTVGKTAGGTAKKAVVKKTVTKKVLTG